MSLRTVPSTHGLDSASQQGVRSCNGDRSKSDLSNGAALRALKRIVLLENRSSPWSPAGVFGPADCGRDGQWSALGPNVRPGLAQPSSAHDRTLSPLSGNTSASLPWLHQRGVYRDEL